MIAEREYQVQSYQHLDLSLPISLAPATRIFHVTKEFGPATMGGLGVMLTALAIAQAESPYLAVSVVLPFYSFLRADFPSQIAHFADLRVSIAGTKGSRPKLVGCVVSLLKWEYSSATDFLDPDRNLDSAIDRRSIDIYLIGPGDQKPFSVAFKATDAGDVYSAYKPLKQEWKDLWFAKAAAELLSFLASGSGPEEDDEVGWELELQDTALDTREPSVGVSGSGKVDVVHLHGATNAMVASFLSQNDDERTSAIVYTLHDSLDEVEYSNLVVNLLAFLDASDLSPRFLRKHSPYIVEKQLYTSALGIDLADVVTFVSRSIASDIVQGRFRFAMQDLVMPSLSLRAKERRFFGITNGLDFTDPAKNPFTSPLLVARSLAFPRVGPNVTDPLTLFPPTQTSLSPTSFSQSKLLAKTYLVASLPAHFRFTHLDASRPYLLFIGRFQYNKGCQFFEPILDFLSSAPEHDARLILMGARNNYPHDALRRLASRYPDHLTLIDDVEDQKRFGTIIRMASDFALVPSFSEAFGLVAAEGLLFGMSVISTSVGGLSEFLVPIVEGAKVGAGAGGKGGTAYTFDLFGPAGAGGGELGRVRIEALVDAVAGCLEAVRRAVRDWRERMEPGMERWKRREMFVRERVADALRLEWSREGGPIEEVRSFLLFLGADTKLTHPVCTAVRQSV